MVWIFGAFLMLLCGAGLLAIGLLLPLLGWAIEQFPISVNRGDSLGAANKILWPSPS